MVMTTVAGDVFTVVDLRRKENDMRNDFMTREELTEIVVRDKNSDYFFNIFEDNDVGPRFDCVCSCDECMGNAEIYIIDRDTGHYIGWYKLYHIGRDWHTNMSSKEEVEKFFDDFYEIVSRRNNEEE